MQIPYIPLKNVYVKWIKYTLYIKLQESILTFEFFFQNIRKQIIKHSSLILVTQAEMQFNSVLSVGNYNEYNQLSYF